MTEIILKHGGQGGASNCPGSALVAPAASCWGRGRGAKGPGGGQCTGRRWGSRGRERALAELVDADRVVGVCQLLDL